MATRIYLHGVSVDVAEDYKDVIHGFKRLTDADALPPFVWYGTTLTGGLPVAVTAQGVQLIEEIPNETN